MRQRQRECVCVCSGAHGMREWIFLKLKALVQSFRIRNATDFIAVYIHPDNRKIPESNSELGRKIQQ